MEKSTHKLILIREYKPSDKNRIEILAKRVFNGSMDSYWSIRYLDRCSKAFVAQLNGEIVGVIEIGVKRIRDKLHGQIGYIFTDPQHRGKGIGSKLLEKGLQYLKFIGAWAAWALTDADNYPTRALFRKFGFREFFSPKELKGILSRREIFSLLRWLIYWVGDVILYKPLSKEHD